MDKYFSEIVDGQQFNPIVIVPVVFAFVGAILVFVFGFKKPVEPHFKKISFDLSKKNKKTEKGQKVSQNGNILTSNKSSENKKNSFIAGDKIQGSFTKKEKNFDKKYLLQHKKVEHNKFINLNKKSIAKNEKHENSKEINASDDGEWMIVTSRADKRKKLEESQNNTQNSVLERNKKEIQKQRNEKKQKEQVDKTKKESNKVRKTDVSTNLNVEKSKKNKSEQMSPKLEESDKVKVPPEVNQKIDDVPLSQDSCTSNDPTKETSNIVFDELQDIWTEKTPKKSKKKSRKE